MITTIETDDADHEMWCPECAYPLYQFAGDYGTGVFAPDGYEEHYWEEGLRCSHCNVVLEGKELEAYLQARQEKGNDDEPEPDRLTEVARAIIDHYKHEFFLKGRASEFDAQDVLEILRRAL